MLSKRNTGKNDTPVLYYDFSFSGNRYRGVGETQEHEPCAFKRWFAIA